MRLRLAAVSAVVFSLVALVSADQARAAAEVHRFNLVLSATPTQVNGGDFNDAIDAYNDIALSPYGLEAMKKIQFTWSYDTELRYFVRPNFAVAAGVSHLRASQKKEFLPAIGQSTNIRAEVLTVPVHVGVAYYLQPYNQGDFQARMYLGGGLMQYTYTRATFGQNVIGPDTSGSGTFKYGLTQDSPGYYLEGGGHMFFASHWSVLIGVVYRDGKLSNMQLDELVLNGQRQSIPRGSAQVWTDTKGNPFQLDVGGVGVRFAAAYGF